MKRSVMPLAEVLAGAEQRRSECSEARKPALAGNAKLSSGRYSSMFDALNEDIVNRHKPT